jgi:hypothetical protein
MNDLFVDCIKGQRRESFERCTSPWRGSLAVLDLCEAHTEATRSAGSKGRKLF